jgi:molybdopterin-binding protein
MALLPAPEDICAGKLLAMGEGWQVHRLLPGVPGADQQTAAGQQPGQQAGQLEGGSFMVLLRLPRGAIISSVDVQCGERSIVVSYRYQTVVEGVQLQEAEGAAAACEAGGARCCYIVLPERISRQGVRATMCAETGSLVVRAAVVPG